MLISGLDDAADMRLLAPDPVPVTIPVTAGTHVLRPEAAVARADASPSPSPTFAAFVEALKNIFGFEVAVVDPHDMVPNGPLDLLALATEQSGLRNLPLLSIDVFA